MTYHETEPPKLHPNTAAKLKASPYRTSKCGHCGTPYKPLRSDQRYCSTKCNSDATNLAMKRGREIYPWVYDWRKARGKNKKEAFAAFCRVADRWAREDREAGRPAPKGYQPGEAWRLPS